MTEFNEYLKAHPNISMLGLAWALYWRLAVVLIPAVAIIGMVFDALSTNY